MTEQTPLLKVNRPSEHADPYYNDIVSYFDGMDAIVQANQENHGVFIHTNAIVTLDGDTLSWDAPIYLRFSRAGKTLTIAAGSATVEDGKIFYAVAPTRPVVDASVSLVAGNPGPEVRNVVPIGMRVGTRVYFFNLEPKPWDKTFISGSIPSLGDWDEHVEMKLDMPSCNFQLVLLKMTSGTVTDTEIRIYDGDPSGAGVVKYLATALDLTLADHEDPNVWFFEMPTSGDFYFRVSNKGGSAAEYSLRLRLQRG